MQSLGLFLLLVAGGWASLLDKEPAVKVFHGVLQGVWKTSTKGRTYGSFEGIPYAHPPIGENRFQEPRDLKPWLGLWDASQPLSNCMQYDPFMGVVTGNEDCLYLNVYSPKPHKGADMPVVVFIHGGAFMYGAGSLYDPSHLMDKNVVVVTLNYRLGPLGFLSTGDNLIPGNAGLKDQAKALRWVRENIEVFGGNPESVTLTGCSAGGASVHYQYLSPLSKGTFARGIAFSGSAFLKWALQMNPAEKARKLAADVGCPTTISNEMLECLQLRNAGTIVAAQTEQMSWKVRMFTPFVPTVEAANVYDPFLTQYPYHAALAGNMHKVPLITSVTSEEGLYPAAVYQTDPKLLLELETKWSKLASNIFEYNDTIPLKRQPEVAAKIKEKYLNGQPVSDETFPQLVQALGDRLFVVDVGKFAQVHALKSGQPVYVYRYSFRGDGSLSNLMARNRKNYGVSHADDVFHIFKFPEIMLSSGQDYLMTEALIDMIYSFSTTGEPKVTEKGPKWTPLTPDSPEINYLEISSPTKTEMKISTDFGQRSFWDSLGFNENEMYQNYKRDEL